MSAPHDTAPPLLEEHIRAVRPGHGANCSSIGSVVDTLFVTAVLGGATFAAIVAALRREKPIVVGPEPREAPASTAEDGPGADEASRPP